MDIDYGVIIGLIGVVCLAGIILLSYAGAYLLGKARGQRDVERQRRQEEQRTAASATDRVMVVETAVEALAKAVERMTDAQRVAMLQTRGPVEVRSSRPVTGMSSNGGSAPTPTPT